MIRIYQDEDHYFTIGVKRYCTCKDIKEELIDHMGSAVTLWECEKGSENQFLNEREIQENEILMDLQRLWDEENKPHYFVVKMVKFFFFKTPHHF